MKKISKSEREIAVDFMNWTATGDCYWELTDEDCWELMNGYGAKEDAGQITTDGLFDIYLAFIGNTDEDEIATDSITNEERIIQRAEKIQKDFGFQADAILRSSKESLDFQDAINVLLYKKIAELEIDIENLKLKI